MRVFKDGAWHTVSAGHAYIGGAWRSLTRGRAYISGAWREIGVFVPPITVTTDPNPFYNEGAYGDGIVYCYVEATPSGGHGPYSYAWTVQSSSAPVTLSSSNTATVLASADESLAPVTATLRCTVTDSVGQSTIATVTGTLEAAEPGSDPGSRNPKMFF